MMRLSCSGLSVRDLDQALGGGLDLDQAPVLQPHGVAVVEHRRGREIEQEREPAVGDHGHAAAMALVIRERHPVGGGFGDRGGAAHDGGGAQHGSPQNRK